MKREFLLLCVAGLVATEVQADADVTDLGIVTVEASALSRYRAETVTGATFTDENPEGLPTSVDTLTGDFIRERNPTDLNDLLRWVPGLETGGTSLLVRQPGLFSVRGMGGTEPAYDGVIPAGRGAGLFLDPALMERVEIVKGPIASLAGGAGAQQNNNGAGGAINLYLKGAKLDGSRREVQEKTSVGRNTWRQRASIDANEVVVDDVFAVRLAGAFDFFSPTYCNTGSQEGARPRESWSLAPSFVVKPNDDVTFGLKTAFVRCDAPSYVGVPVWRGSPGGGYGWRESSCLPGDRSTFAGMMLEPYLDWQVTDAWRLLFGGAFVYSHLEQTTREPYTETGKGLSHYYATGRWLDGEAMYQTTDFSESRSFGRSFNLFARSVWKLEELPGGFRNVLLAQPDFYYRDSSGGFGTPTSRYGVTLQDTVGWKWFALLAGLRYDYFVENDAHVTTTARGRTTTTHLPEARAYAFSPRGGLTVQPLDGLVLFANVSATQTPTLGYVATDGKRPTDPWTATQWEAGVRVRPFEKLWLSASYYAIDQENTPVADTVGATTTYSFEGHNRSSGVEVSLSGDVTDDWTVWAAYAYNRFEDCNPDDGQPGVFARTPNHAVTLATSYRLHGFDLIDDVVVNFGYRFRSESYATMRGAYVDDNLYFNPSHVFDVGLTIPLAKFGLWENWYLTFGVRNLFDARYFDTSRHYYECFAGEPRTFDIGIRSSF